MAIRGNICVSLVGSKFGGGLGGEREGERERGWVSEKKEEWDICIEIYV